MAWIQDFNIKTARINMSHTFDGPKVFFQIRGENKSDNFSMEISMEDAISMMCADISDAEKYFYVPEYGKDANKLKEVPRGYEENIRRGSYSMLTKNVFFETRKEAKAHLAARLQKQAADLLKEE